MIKEELDELKEAIDKKDLKEVADALTDIFRNLWSWTCIWSKFRRLFNGQCSNMSKLGVMVNQFLMKKVK